MQIPKISILGCGWLGLPLAVELIKDGFSVKGSTTSHDKIQILEENSIEPFLISVSAEGIKGNITEFLLSDILIIDIPPKTSNGNFAHAISRLIPYIERSEIANVLFVGSISVYPDFGLVNEKTILNPKTENGMQLVEAENLLQSASFKTTVLRFGGLVGNQRHPARNLAGRENLPNPDAPINLIHLNDCIAIIKAIILRNSWEEVFNGVDTFHPTREEFYTKKAREFGLPIPCFDHSKPSVGKTVSSAKLAEMLDYKFSGLLE